MTNIKKRNESSWRVTTRVTVLGRRVCTNVGRAESSIGAHVRGECECHWSALVLKRRVPIDRLVLSVTKPSPRPLLSAGRVAHVTRVPNAYVRFADTYTAPGSITRAYKLASGVSAGVDNAWSLVFLGYSQPNE